MMSSDGTTEESSDSPLNSKDEPYEPPRGKSFLIDSILRGMPLPQFFVREIVLPKEKRTVREAPCFEDKERFPHDLG